MRRRFERQHRAVLCPLGKRPTNIPSIGQNPTDGKGAVQGSGDMTDPAAKGRLKCLRVEQTKDAQKGILGRNAVLEHQKLAQPGCLGTTPAGEVFDRIAIREHRRDGDQQNLLKVVQRSVAWLGLAWLGLAWLARIIDLAQAVHQTLSPSSPAFRSPKRRE